MRDWMFLLLVLTGLVGAEASAQNKGKIVLDLSQSGISVLDTSVINNPDVQYLILDGNRLDLIKNADVLCGLKKLEFLSLKNCNIDFLPPCIGDLSNLKWINLEGNQLEFLPFTMKELHQLEELNIGFNKIDSVGFELSRLTGLQSLIVSGNKNIKLSDQNLSELPLTNFEAVGVKNLPEQIGGKKLKNLVLGMNGEATYKGVIPDSSKIEDLVVYSKELKSYTRLCNDLKKTQIKSLTIGSMKLELLPYALGKINTLEELIITESPIKALPSSFGTLTNLKSLTLNGKFLREMNEPLLKLEGLEKLDIRNTNISEKDYKELVKGLPNCEIIADFLEMSSPTPLKDEKPEFREVKSLVDSVVEVKTESLIDPKRSNVVPTKGGSALIVPKNAFVDGDGKIVTDSVKLEVKEYNDPLSMYLAGIPNRLDSAGSTYALAASKVVEVKATVNGDSVGINPDNPPVIEVEDNGGKPKTYQFKVKKGKWEEGQDIDVVMDSLDRIQFKLDSTAFKMGKFDKKLVYDEVYMAIYTDKSLGGYCLRFGGPRGNKLNARTSRGRDPERFALYPLNAIMNDSWLLMSSNPESKIKKLNSLLGEEKTDINGKYKAYRIHKLERFELVLDYERDVLTFELSTEDQRVVFDAIPAPNITDQIRSSQRKTERIKREYNKLSQKADWTNFYNDSLLQGQYSKYLEQYRKYNDSTKTSETDYKTYRRSSHLYQQVGRGFRPPIRVPILRSGLLMLGKPNVEIKELVSEGNKIKPIGKDSSELAVVSLVVLSSWRNIYEVSSCRSFDYSMVKKVALLAVLGNGDFALLDSETFKKLRKGRPKDEQDFGKVVFEVVPGENFEIEKYREKLKI